MAAAYLVIGDLELLVGTERVQHLFDDDIDGSTADSSNEIANILEAAEAEAASHLKRSWSDAAITDLANNDTGLKNHVAWVALEFASERRPEFTDEEGWGSYKAQYQRAIEYFKNLSKGKTRSLGEAQAGVGSNIGGTRQPDRQNDAALFTFAPDTLYPGPRGGF
jgi:hypothetical protein